MRKIPVQFAQVIYMLSMKRRYRSASWMQRYLKFFRISLAQPDFMITLFVFFTSGESIILTLDRDSYSTLGLSPR